MDWLKSELTDIAKIRRYVILFGSLSCLLAFFPVSPDEVSILGAKFHGNVLAFALFHSLAFYTLVLAVRAIIHRGLNNMERFRFEADLLVQIESSKDHLQSRTKELLTVQRNRLDRRQDDYAKLLDRHEKFLAQQRLNQTIADSENASPEERERALERLRQLAAQIASNDKDLSRVKQLVADAELQTGLTDPKVAHIERQLRDLTGQEKFIQHVSRFILVGEYVFPVCFGIFSAGLLVTSQSFPMLWELTTKH